ncbi:MAG: D-alanyl-D-alanine carboxypeptidase [Pseudomonadota bacterium]
MQKDVMQTHRCFTPCTHPIAVIAFVLVLAIAGPALANPKYAGFVMDANTGKTLYSDNADAKRFPASLTKIMTLYLVFDELKAGKLKLDTGMTVSKYAAQRPPSKLGLRIGSQLKVRDAIKALVTKSANDAATVVAEHIAGSETAFAKRMTAKARELGMSSTTFRNPHGLPNRYQVTTARDMARLGLAIQRDHPEYYGVFQTRSFRFGKKTFRNHNRLLGRVKGVDGIKTGYIRASGFNLTTSVRRNGRHIVAVVMGGRTGKSRNAHMTDLVGRYLPKASRGEPLPLMAWTGRDIQAIPVPRRKPGAAILLASANQPAADDPIAQRVLAFTTQAQQTIAAPEAAALRAVIAQASGTPVEPAAVVRTAAVAPPTERPLGYAPTAPALAQAAAPQPATRDDKIETAFRVAALSHRGDQMAKLIALAKKRAKTEDPSGWQVQLGAMPTKAGAERVIRDAVAKQPGLAAKTPVTQKIETPNGPLFRARLSGFATQNDARAACERLTKPERVCWVISA